MLFPRTFWHRTALAAAVALGAILAQPLTAASSSQEGPPQLTDYTVDQINQNLRPALDKKEWAKALEILDRIVAKAAPYSYDMALANGIRARTYLQQNNLLGALKSLETTVAITDRHPNYFSKKDTLENVYNISQIAYQIAASSKDSKVQQQYFGVALSKLQRWLNNTNPKNYTENNDQFIASLYFTIAQGAAGNDKQQVDRKMMEKALEWIDRGLHSTLYPRDVFYQLKVSALFQLNRLKEGAEYLEMRLKKKPDNKGYWQQLAYSYVQLSDDAQKKHDDKGYFTYNVRAILTMQRAQQHGFLNTPKDNYQVVGMFFNINQYGEACDLLSRGLHDGGIDSTVQNWQLLAYSYQQMHRDAEAIKTLEEASKRFPKSGQLEYQLAQTYYGNNQLKEALKHIKLCVEKGGPDKPGIGWYFYAVIAYNLKDYSLALKAAAEAAKYPGTVQEARRIEKGVKASIQDLKNRAAAAADGVTAY